MYNPSSRELRIWAAGAAALVAVAVVAGVLFGTAVHYPALAAGVGLIVAGIAAGVYAWVLHRREMREYRRDCARRQRWLDDNLSDSTLAWVLSTWSRRYGR
jgi:dolichol kinase